MSWVDFMFPQPVPLGDVGAFEGACRQYRVFHEAEFMCPDCCCTVERRLGQWTLAGQFPRRRPKLGPLAVRHTWLVRSLTADSPGIILDARSTSENYHIVRGTLRERVREYCEGLGSVVADISVGDCRQGSVPRFGVQ